MQDTFGNTFDVGSKVFWVSRRYGASKGTIEKIVRRVHYKWGIVNGRWQKQGIGVKTSVTVRVEQNPNRRYCSTTATFTINPKTNIPNFFVTD